MRPTPASPWSVHWSRPSSSEPPAPPPPRRATPSAVSCSANVRRTASPGWSSRPPHVPGGSDDGRSLAPRGGASAQGGRGRGGRGRRRRGHLHRGRRQGGEGLLIGE